MSEDKFTIKELRELRKLYIKQMNDETIPLDDRDWSIDDFLNFMGNPDYWVAERKWEPETILKKLRSRPSSAPNT